MTSHWISSSSHYASVLEPFFIFTPIHVFLLLYVYSLPEYIYVRNKEYSWFAKKNRRGSDNNVFSDNIGHDQ